MKKENLNHSIDNALDEKLCWGCRNKCLFQVMLKSIKNKEKVPSRIKNYYRCLQIRHEIASMNPIAKIGTVFKTNLSGGEPSSNDIDIIIKGIERGEVLDVLSGLTFDIHSDTLDFCGLEFRLPNHDEDDINYYSILTHALFENGCLTLDDIMRLRRIDSSFDFYSLSVRDNWSPLYKWSKNAIKKDRLVWVPFHLLIMSRFYKMYHDGVWPIKQQIMNILNILKAKDSGRITYYSPPNSNGIFIGCGKKHCKEFDTDAP